MEKFSAYRDPGTGIHPFLSPVPPQDHGSLFSIAKPMLYLLGAARTILVIMFALIYVALIQGVCTLFYPFPPLRRALSSMLTSILCRISLLLVGIYWLPVEIVKRKRGRFSRKETWSPKPGDLIVSNWISWLEIAWLAFRFNPMFIIPVTDAVEKAISPTSSPSRVTPGRRTGTGSAAIALPNQHRPQVKRAEVRGFVEDFHSAFTGRNPYASEEIGSAFCYFSECTTSNGRGLLRFANVFKGISIPVKDFNVFVMCVRIDPPTVLSPTLSLPIPSSQAILNPIPHIFSICSSVVPHAISIRLLAPSDSPSSDTFPLSEVISGSVGGDDALTEACSTLISEVGRVKRTGMGWEDKAMFLEFYKGKSGR